MACNKKHDKKHVRKFRKKRIYFQRSMILMRLNIKYIVSANGLNNFSFICPDKQGFDFS